MQTVVKEVIGFEVEYNNIPETLPEAISLAGSEAVVLQAFINYVIFHKQNGVARDRIVDHLVKVTKVPQITETTGEGEKAKTVVVETPGSYVSRLSGLYDENFFAEQAQAIRHIAPTIDWTQAERGGGLGRIAQKWLTGVEQLIEMGKFDRFCEVYGVDAELPEDVKKHTAAHALKKVIEEEEQKAKAQVMAKLNL